MKKIKLESLSSFAAPDTTFLYQIHGGVQSQTNDTSGFDDSSQSNDTSNLADSSDNSDTSNSYDSSNTND
jgi:hypothetical protein